MDRIQQLNYEKDFRIAFLEARGDDFQRLFETLMAKAQAGDFMACRPSGNVGDRKNDGYLVSTRTAMTKVVSPQSRCHPPKRSG